MGILDKFSSELLKLLAVYLVVIGLFNYVIISLLELGLPDSTLGVINFSFVLLLAVFFTYKNRRKG